MSHPLIPHASLKDITMVGHDDVIDVTKGWGEQYPQPFQLNELSADDLRNVAFLFGGVGDARHVFGSLRGLSTAHQAMGAKKQADFHAHLTLFDIHDATIARDLCMFMLLHELNCTDDEAVRIEIKATLMYTFCGAVMPSYCYSRNAASRSFPGEKHLQMMFSLKSVKTSKQSCLTCPGPKHSKRQMIVSCPVPLGDRHIKERIWYAQTKVFLPPEELRLRHPDFGTAWVEVQKAREMEVPDLSNVNVHIESDWKPNITLIHSNIKGYPDLSEDLFEAINAFQKFNEHINTSTGDARTPQGRSVDRSKSSAGGEVLAWDVCNVFFEQTAAALKSLDGKITLEFLIDDICKQLAKMRCGDDSTRPMAFPRKFARIWLSNVPLKDYTHGPLNVILYVAPNLQDRPYAGVACNSLLNTSAWRDDDEFFHTYTLLKIKDVPRYLGCTLLNSNAVMEILLLGPSPSLPRPLSELATREELTTWLTRVLFNTFIPGRSEPVLPCDTRLPHNLVAFFGLLVYLHRIGYPGHWLSDFLARVLSGRMLSDVVPYTGEYPIPVDEYRRRVPARVVCTDPWLVEFETIIATAYYATPFPVASALPADSSRDAEDVAVWEVPYHPVTHLLFFRADKLSADEVIVDMREIFEGRSSLAPGTFFVLTSQ
ncbi:hypothetical protein C8Q80DRAFT_1125297 [Daedaleopsis nitida]|nr:hypothetical protein C8Q80DRAFT_1125297 [Daedaleopsis nitida]